MTQRTQDEYLRQCLQRYSRIDFGVMMRQVEIALFVYSNVELAIRSLRHFAAKQPIGEVTIESWVIEALPMRMANFLEQAGYLNLHAVDKASDEDLLAIRGFGKSQLQFIRKALRMVKAGVYVKDQSEDEDLAPEWDFYENFREMVPDYQTKPCNFKGTGQVTANGKTDLAQALMLLMEHKDEAVAEIDQKIEELQSELSHLKSMKKMLGGTTLAKTSLAKPVDEAAESLIEKLLLVHGPLTCGEIGKQLEMHHVAVGHVVRRSKKFKIDGKTVMRA